MSHNYYSHAGIVISVTIHALLYYIAVLNVVDTLGFYGNYVIGVM